MKDAFLRLGFLELAVWVREAGGDITASEMPLADLPGGQVRALLQDEYSRWQDAGAWPETAGRLLGLSEGGVFCLLFGALALESADFRDALRLAGGSAAADAAARVFADNHGGRVTRRERALVEAVLWVLRSGGLRAEELEALFAGAEGARRAAFAQLIEELMPGAALLPALSEAERGIWSAAVREAERLRAWTDAQGGDFAAVCLAGEEGAGRTACARAWAGAALRVDAAAFAVGRALDVSPAPCCAAVLAVLCGAALCVENLDCAQWPAWRPWALWLRERGSLLFAVCQNEEAFARNGDFLCISLGIPDITERAQIWEQAARFLGVETRCFPAAAPETDRIARQYRLAGSDVASLASSLGGAEQSYSSLDAFSGVSCELLAGQYALTPGQILAVLRSAARTAAYRATSRAEVYSGQAQPALRGVQENCSGAFITEDRNSALTLRGMQKNCPGAFITENRNPAPTLRDVQESCHRFLRRDFGSRAVRVEAGYCLEDLVLPEAQKERLRAACDQVRFRRQVLEGWGLGRKMAYGTGVSLIFAGPPGTGKTMAAQILAGMLGMELYRVELAAVVSKYIGETEKNLEQIFDAAEKSQVVLFFDEADALFGRRTEVRDSNDKYSNMEAAFLLQKMEAYSGVAILATNLLKNMDEAFKRRMKFIIDFPFPGRQERMELWRRAIPAEVPRAEELDLAFLAERFELSGSNIRNIVYHACFLAAGSGRRLGMRELMRALKNEYEKSGKTLTRQEAEPYGDAL